MSSKSDMEIDTNLLNTDNPVLALGQDVAAGIAAEEGIKAGLKVAGKGGQALIIKAMGKEAAEKAAKKLTKKMTNTLVSKALSKAITKMINSKIVQMIGKRVNAVIIKMLLKTGTQKGAQIAAGMAAKTAIAVGAGCAAGPIGCAGGAVVGAALMAFDAMNLVMGVMDKNGYQIVFNQDFIDGIAAKYEEALDKGFSDAGIDNYFDEEILFQPEKFIFNTSADGSLVINEKWGPKYNKHIDDYMKTINVKPGWRDRMESEELKLDPSINEELVAFKMEEDADQQKKKKNTVILIIVGIAVMLLLWFLFSSGGNSNNNTNNNNSNSNSK